MASAASGRSAGPSVSPEARNRIGVETTRQCDPVSARHVREYLAAVELPWGGTEAPAPPLFVLAATRRVQPKARLLADGQYDDLMIPGIDGRSVLASWDIEIEGQVHVGDVITVEEAVVSIEEKAGSSGPLVIVKKQARHRNQDGTALATETQTIIYR